MIQSKMQNMVRSQAWAQFFVTDQISHGLPKTK